MTQSQALRLYNAMTAEECAECDVRSAQDLWEFGSAACRPVEVAGDATGTLRVRSKPQLLPYFTMAGVVDMLVVLVYGPAEPWTLVSDDDDIEPCLNNQRAEMRQRLIAAL